MRSDAPLAIVAGKRAITGDLSISLLHFDRLSRHVDVIDMSALIPCYVSTSAPYIDTYCGCVDAVDMSFDSSSYRATF
jgi:hypothetical protein